MFEAWGRRMYAWRWATLAASGLVLVASVLLLVRGGRLTTGVIHGIEADTAAGLIDAQLHAPGGRSFTAIFHSDALTTDDAAFREAMLAAVAPLRADPRVASVRTPFDRETSMFVAEGLRSLDGHRALAEVALRPEAVADTGLFPGIRARLRPTALDVTVTGPVAFKSDLDHVLEEDMRRGEVLSTPVSVLVLLLVFGSLVAAVVPVGVGGLAVVGGVAVVMALSRRVEVAQYAVNVVSLVGLGVAIDYSLFMVSRFREELARGAAVPDALARSVATAGRAVVFSGLAVAIGLSGLFFFRGSYVASIGVGGTVVVGLAVLYALTFLPALLGVLGHRVNGGRIPRPALRATGTWHRIAVMVMRRPVWVLVPTLAVLAVAAWPFLDLEIAIPDVGVLPPRAEARRGDALLREHFPERVATRVAVVARFPGAPLGTAARIGALYDLSRRLAAIPGVVRVESVVDLDATLDRARYQAVLGGPRGDLGEPERVAIEETVGPTIAVLAAVTEAEPASHAARAIVRAARAQRAVADGALLVTGQTAMDLDTAAFLRAHVPGAVAWVLGMTVLVLFVLLGSAVLPFKAVAMNLLSLSGSFGALVWIFQQGHLRGALRFTPGPIEPSLPIVLFCATFGLSMDYEVLLLTRIQEEWERTGDNTHAVAEGLERSGPLITSAALIMVVVFAAFAMADIVLLKVLGVGMALTVALDATLVRVLVVPAAMRLFGDLNWWAPAFLRRLQRRVTGH